MAVLTVTVHLCRYKVQIRGTSAAFRCGTPLRPRGHQQKNQRSRVDTVAMNFFGAAGVFSWMGRRRRALCEEDFSKTPRVFRKNGHRARARARNGYPSRSFLPSRRRRPSGRKNDWWPRIRTCPRDKTMISSMDLAARVCFLPKIISFLNLNLSVRWIILCNYQLFIKWETIRSIR